MFPTCGERKRAFSFRNLASPNPKKKTLIKPSSAFWVSLCFWELAVYSIKLVFVGLHKNFYEGINEQLLIHSQILSKRTKQCQCLVISWIKDCHKISAIRILCLVPKWSRWKWRGDKHTFKLYEHKARQAVSIACRLVTYCKPDLGNTTATGLLQ